MKKGLIILIGACLLMSSCGSYEATGAYTGSQFGNILGSAIGGIAGGWRGHEIGSLVGTVGGAAAGAAIGHAADKSQQRKYEKTWRQQQQPADDRITFRQEAAASYALSIRNAEIYEEMRDGVLTRGESCQIVFEIANNSEQPVYDIFPLVEEATGNRHVHISPNLRVESIAPRQAIRYTATLRADNGLKNGQIEVRVGVAQGRNVVDAETRQFRIPTSRDRR